MSTSSLECLVNRWHDRCWSSLEWIGSAAICSGVALTKLGENLRQFRDFTTSDPIEINHQVDAVDISIELMAATTTTDNTFVRFILFIVPIAKPRATCYHNTNHIWILKQTKHSLRQPIAVTWNSNELEMIFSHFALWSRICYSSSLFCRLLRAWNSCFLNYEWHTWQVSLLFSPIRSFGALLIVSMSLCRHGFLPGSRCCVPC